MKIERFEQAHFSFYSPAVYHFWPESEMSREEQYAQAQGTFYVKAPFMLMKAVKSRLVKISMRSTRSGRTRCKIKLSPTVWVRMSEGEAELLGKKLIQLAQQQRVKRRKITL